MLMQSVFKTNPKVDVKFLKANHRCYITGNSLADIRSNSVIKLLM